MGTLIWTDDFESYTAGAAVPSPWANVANSPVSTAQAHAGTKSLAVGTGGNASTCSRPLGSSVSQWYADFWMWTNASGGTIQFIAFSPSSTSNNSGPSVSVSSAGAGTCGQANGATWFTFSASVGVWHHYVFEVLSAAAGTAKLTVDGVVAGTFSGNTRDNFSSTASVAHVWVQGSTIGPSPPAEFYLDDLSMYNGTAAPAFRKSLAFVVS